jgi:hypothetical protein
MSDGTVKVYNRNTIRRSFEVYFTNEEEKKQFCDNFENLRKQSNCNTNGDLIKMLMNMPKKDQDERVQVDPLEHSATYNNEYAPSLFVGEKKTILSFCTDVQLHSKDCSDTLRMTECDMNVHVCKMVFECGSGHRIVWQSSSKMGESDQFVVNERLYLAYLASGIIPQQYIKFSDFARMGGVTSKHLQGRLPRFHAVVSFLKEHSMRTAVSEEVAETKRERASMNASVNENGQQGGGGGEDGTASGVQGISVMTDARHACRKNSYHTDHVTLGQRSHKVLDLQHITKEDDHCSQRHEHVGCTRMYDAMDAAGVAIEEHTHDRNVSINKLIKTKGARNVNERWHVAKSVTSGVKKLGSGTRITEGKTWHPDLADKATLMRDHVYWSIDNCDGDKDRLRQLLDISLEHFQDKHEKCHHSSSCKAATYIPSFIVVRHAVAVKLLTDFLHKHVVYKNAEDFAFARDTFYVESFNNVCLVYIPKRIHFKTNIHYDLRMALAVLDWNEHVDRPATSFCVRQDAAHQRRQRGARVLKPKTFEFVDDIWRHLVDQDRPFTPDDQGADNESSNDDDDDCQDNDELAW